MSKSTKKSKKKDHTPVLAELDDVDALFFLSEVEPRPSEKPRLANQGAQSEAKEPPKILAVVSRKGGTGKTSIAMNLAEALSTKRRRVMVIDLDRGADAAKWAGRGGDLAFTVKRVDHRGGEEALKDGIAEAAAQADLLILDTPPANPRVMSDAVQVADLVLIPTGPSALDVRATVDVVTESVRMREADKQIAPRIALVPSRLMSRTRLARELPKKLEELSASRRPWNRAARRSGSGRLGGTGRQAQEPGRTRVLETGSFRLAPTESDVR